MTPEIAFFLPTRRGSERVLNKNTRTFAGIKGGLLQLKLMQLLEVPDVPIYLSTNDVESVDIAKAFDNTRIHVVDRPEHLCLSTTLLSDFIAYVPTIIKEEHIIWVHTTEPFIDKVCLENAIKIYSEEVLNKQEFDSLMSCNKIQTFLWDKDQGTFVSHDRDEIKWPRSQDIKPVYEVNSAIFINSKANYVKYGDRIGHNPYLFELNKLQSVDIDWEDDFKMAELLYESIRKI